jgi:hypothetical protein
MKVSRPRHRAATRLPAAVGWLGAGAFLAFPDAALLPCIDLGLAEDAPCNRLIAEAREAAAQPQGDG